MKKILIIKTGSTYVNIKNQFGDFEDWIISGMEIDKSHVIIHNIQNNVKLKEPKSYTGIIITGSHSMVTDNEEWINSLSLWLGGAVKAGIPILGICFGHQVLAKAIGGKTDFNPKGREIGTKTVNLTKAAKEDELFRNCPDKFSVYEAHQQSVIELPKNAVILAQNEHDRHQAFVINNCAWGVQFHPEFNYDILRSYIDQQSGTLKEEGFNINSLYTSLKSTTDDIKILKRFLKIVESSTK